MVYFYIVVEIEKNLGESKKVKLQNFLAKVVHYRRIGVLESSLC